MQSLNSVCFLKLLLLLLQIIQRWRGCSSPLLSRVPTYELSLSDLTRSWRPSVETISKSPVIPILAIHELSALPVFVMKTTFELLVCLDAVTETTPEFTQCLVMAMKAAFELSA